MVNVFSVWRKERINDSTFINKIRDKFRLLQGAFELNKLYFLKITTWIEDVTIFMQHLNDNCKKDCYTAVCVTNPAQETRRKILEMNKLYYKMVLKLIIGMLKTIQNKHPV